MPVIAANGIQISYLQAGKGRDVVMVHGLAANLSFWWWTVVPFIARTHRVTVYDLRGHGHSSMPSTGYTTDVMADDLLCLLDALGMETVHLVGHSLGGAISLACALKTPERVDSLALADCRIQALQPLRSRDDELYWQEWRERLRKSGVAVTPDTPRIVYSMLEEIQPLVASGYANPNAIPGLLVRKGGFDPKSRAAIRWKRLVDETTFAEDIRRTASLTPDRIRDNALPTLLSYGADSACMETLLALEQLLPGCHSVLHQGVGHFFPAISPRLLIRDLCDFLSEIEAGSPGECSMYREGPPDPHRDAGRIVRRWTTSGGTGH